MEVGVDEVRRCGQVLVGATGKDCVEGCDANALGDEDMGTRCRSPNEVAGRQVQERHLGI